jgi:hypothetical protein
MTKKLCPLILLFTALAAGQGFDIKRLDWLAASASNTVDVTLEGPLLQLATKFLSSNEPDEAKIKKLVGGLKGIYVRSFEFDKEGAYSESDVATLRNQLRAPDWSRLVGVRSKRDSENVDLFLRTNHESGGLAIIVANPKQLTVVQILGKLDLDQLSELGGSLGIPKLDLEKTSKPPAKKEHEE